MIRIKDIQDLHFSILLLNDFTPASKNVNIQKLKIYITHAL
jgi:hypothetical protein